MPSFGDPAILKEIDKIASQEDLDSKPKKKGVDLKRKNRHYVYQGNKYIN